MSQPKGLREITAISFLLVLNAFFGISDKETAFIFPAFGKEVFTVINFYAMVLSITGVAFAITIIYRHINNQSLDLPTLPPWPIVILNFSIFVIISYIIITGFLTGDFFNIPIPAYKDVVEQLIIASDENALAFIFLTTILPFGTTNGNALKSPINIISLGEYKLNFNPPSIKRFSSGLYAILLITLLHAGAYSYQVSTFSQFYIAMIIALIMFFILWWIMLTFGFGACIAVHWSWNIVLITMRGSVFMGSIQLFSGG